LSGKGKVTATYTRISPSTSSTSLHREADSKPKEDARVPPPPEGPEFVELQTTKKRLFENLRGEGPVYIPLPQDEMVTNEAGRGSGRSRRPRKKKQVEENQPQPEAGPSSNP